MKKEEYELLCKRYNKPYDLDGLELFNELVKPQKTSREPYSNIVVSKAIKKWISESAFFPTVADINKYCEKVWKEETSSIINQMKEKGYFGDVKEFDKSLKFINSGILPKFLKEDMAKYYCQINNVQIEHKDTLLLETEGVDILGDILCGS